MKIAIVGSGVSGLVAANLLRRSHEITVFEKSARVGGHANTITIEVDGKRHHVDTGFIVFNEAMYPRFTKLLQTLNIDSQPAPMGLSVSCERSGLEYSGESFRSLFADPRNAFRPSFWKFLREIGEFRRQALSSLETGKASQTVGEYLQSARFGPRFAEHFLLPLGGALWSCPPNEFLNYPMEFVIRFLHNHDMLESRGLPGWRTISGGSRRYVEALIEPFRDRIRLSCGVHEVRRTPLGVEVRCDRGSEVFDEVIFACHADQALRALVDADSTEREALLAFPYRTNEVALHSDERLLPRRRRAWASWNSRLPADHPSAALVTYNMTMLQSLPTKRAVCVTLNATDRIRPSDIFQRVVYEHPQMNPASRRAQFLHPNFIRRNRTSFCGAYWGFGFHEDGVASAQTVAAAFGGQI